MKIFQPENEDKHIGAARLHLPAASRRIAAAQPQGCFKQPYVFF